MADTELVEKDEISVYEAAFHIDANLSETEVRKTLDKTREAITEAGGTLVAEAAPVRMDLAYTISHIAEGVRRDHVASYFAWIAYELTPEKQGEVDEALRTNKNIIRHLVIKTTKEQAVYAQDRAAEKMSMAKEGSEGQVSDEKLDEALEESTT